MWTEDDIQRGDPEELMASQFMYDHLTFQTTSKSGIRAVAVQQEVGPFRIKYYQWQGCHYQLQQVTPKDVYTIGIFEHAPKGRLVITGAALDTCTGIATCGELLLPAHVLEACGVLRIEIPRRILDPVLASCGIEHPERLFDPIIVWPRSYPEVNVLREVMKPLLWAENSQLDDLVINDMLHLCAVCFEQAPLYREQFRTARCSHLANRTLAYMGQDLSRRVDMSRVAAELGVGRRQIEQCYAQVFGISPARHHLEMRLHGIKRALDAKGIAYGEFGALVKTFGFGHAGRLAGYFADMFGTTPLEYMQRKRTRREPL